MKNFRFLLPGFIFCVFHISAKSQEADSILSYFAGAISENKIQVNWAISGGNTCEGTIVQRSVDGLFFNTIGEIGGVCGSPDFEIPYFFIDENPLPNTVNFYRLELGSQGFSSAIEIEFVSLNEKGYSVRYDFQNQTVIVNFENPKRETVKYMLFDIQGRYLTDGVTKDAGITLSLQSFSPQPFILNLLMFGHGLNIKILKP